MSRVVSFTVGATTISGGQFTVRWLVADGTQVRHEQPILEVEDEKAAFELAAPADGRLDIRAHTGARVGVGELLTLIHPEEAWT